jgi:predicted RNA binding protein YcfA (HicA-like mRNA interferase family)
VSNIDLQNEKNVKFTDLLNFCKKLFGEPRVRGSHHIFKMPWAGHPRVNLQRDGKLAKPYQVKQVKEALKRLKEMKR